MGGFAQTSRVGAGLQPALTGDECKCLCTGAVCDDFLHMWRLIVHSINHQLISCVNVTSSQVSRAVSHISV